MIENKVGELVFRAKGERSYREYGKDCGVDPAVISKIVKGNYIPRKPDVYRKLTSETAKPRNGVTFEQLLKVAKHSTEYRSGLEAGAAVTKAAMSIAGLGLMAIPGVAPALTGVAAGGLTGKLNKQDDKQNKLSQIEMALREHQKFSAIANGLIFGKLAQQGVIFQQETNEGKRYFENQFDTYLKLTGNEYNEYLIRYLYIPHGEDENQWYIENSSRRIVEELIFCKASAQRKVSVVVNNEEAYKYLIAFKGKLSYRGELSVILIDDETVQFLGEEEISTYNED